jgi:hypothetical protein
MLTEARYTVGGPDVYHDSCTYSLYSDHDIADEVRACLRGNPHASGWRLADTVLSAEVVLENAKQGRKAVCSITGWILWTTTWAFKVRFRARYTELLLK